MVCLFLEETIIHEYIGSIVLYNTGDITLPGMTVFYISLMIYHLIMQQFIFITLVVYHYLIP